MTEADLGTKTERVSREERARQTRRRLVDVALELFAENGYDETATDQIATKAGVSPRTFFRYFPTKESVLFFGEYDFIRSFGDVLAAQPEDVNDVIAVRDALIVLAPSVERIKARIALYRRAVASSTFLLGRRELHSAEHIVDLASAIASRRSLDKPDPGANLLASICLMILGQAIDEWLAGDWPSTSVALEECFDRLTSEICQK